ncbi:hypothetical protein [Kordia jejudonensis]|uniref:hypothetical protein n=1 Tax=Kordia jejudonensis TaxID=1348245 RepID=UPI0006296B62|nr:hypothetical protein [Kordia jejudonensis]
MNTKYISTERILLVIIIGLLWYSLLLKSCESDVQLNTKPTITIVKDTIWQTKVDTLHIETTKFEYVYIPVKGTKEERKNFQKEINAKEIAKFAKGKLYKDTLQTDDIDIFTHNLVDGTLIDSKFSYKLKVPREITITKTIEHPPIYKSGLYVFGEIGGNKNQFDNLSLGLQYQHKGNWFASYRVNLNQIQETTHNIGVGVRLW